MSLSGTFNPVGAAQSPPPKAPRPKRKPPFSLRLTEGERVRLEQDARGVPLGAYIKARLFEWDASPVRTRRSGLPVEDRAALGQALARLGASRLSANINQLAFQANCGSLDLTIQTLDKLLEAVADIREIRRLLMVALGLREDEPR